MGRSWYRLARADRGKRSLERGQRASNAPPVIAAWGLFASIFVASTIVLRDFIPALGHMTVTLAFMLSNLIALFSTSIYLAAKGLRAGSR